MRQERTSRCGWEVLGGRKHSTQSQQNIKERSSRGSLPWLNLMSVSEGMRANSGSRLGRSLPRLDQDTAPSSVRQTRQESLQLDIDQILEAPLELRPAEREPWLHQPFIQTEFSHSVLPQVGQSEPLHLFHTLRTRRQVLHCYEFLLLRHLQLDRPLWTRLCERFGHCETCEQEGRTGCGGGAAHPAPPSTHTTTNSKDPFSLGSIQPDLWFLAITLKESRDKLTHFIRSELTKRRNGTELPSLPFSSDKLTNSNSFLSSYLSTFNFVEMSLDNIFKIGDSTSIPKELFKCSNLKSLSLRNNFLDTIPPDIGRLHKLERLFLTNNKLQNKSIPFTIAFCVNLTELYIDNNLLDALPGILLRLERLERLHRHGNHNYFKATFMWYHTDVNQRVLECPGEEGGAAGESNPSPGSLQHLAALAVIQSRINFFHTSRIPARLKDELTVLCEEFDLCSNCSSARPLSAPGYKVFTFKNPYLGNTCVPFQHWTCSLACARKVEVPARREQLSQARQQDIQYERYVRESVSRLRPSQRALSVNSLERGPGESGEEERPAAPEPASCGIL